MSSDRLLELYRQHHTAQDKYTYFLLAVVGAAIGFAVNETHSMKMAMSQIPLALAVICWGLSFFFGCKQLQYVRRVLWDNSDLLKIEFGKHELVGMNPELIKLTADIARKSLADGAKRAIIFDRLQFRFLITGVIFYLGWHILEMWLRK
ncbi:MAG: hypothetical protein ABUS47_10395 [Steroidobacter sp.]